MGMENGEWRKNMTSCPFHPVRRPFIFGGRHVEFSNCILDSEIDLEIDPLPL